MITRAKKKPTIEFGAWMVELNKIADGKGFEVLKGGMRTTELEYWRELYNDGHTPQEAWEQ